MRPSSCKSNLRQVRIDPQKKKLKMQDESRSITNDQRHNRKMLCPKRGRPPTNNTTLTKYIWNKHKLTITPLKIILQSSTRIIYDKEVSENIFSIPIAKSQISRWDTIRGVSSLYSFRETQTLTYFFIQWLR